MLSGIANARNNNDEHVVHPTPSLNNISLNSIREEIINSIHLLNVRTGPPNVAGVV
jgi:hypothetical protein